MTSHAVLNGRIITVVVLARQNYEVVKEDISITKILAYDEIMVTSTTLNIMPIRQIDDMIFQGDFTVTRKIQKLYAENS